MIIFYTGIITLFNLEHSMRIVYNLMSFILYISAKKIFFVFIQFDEEKLVLDGSNGSLVHSNLGEHCRGSHGYNNFI